MVEHGFGQHGDGMLHAHDAGGVDAVPRQLTQNLAQLAQGQPIAALSREDNVAGFHHQGRVLEGVGFRAGRPRPPATTAALLTDNFDLVAGDESQGRRQHHGLAGALH